MHSDVTKLIFRPAWLGLIVLSVILSSSAALWVGLQRDAGETSTTFVFARRVGYLNRPLPVLDDHVNDIINSVEFPIVFERIEDRLLLEADGDYDLEIGAVEDTESVVEIVVRTNRSGDADRIARIVAEEMVSFVLANQDLSIATEIDDLTHEIERLEDEQSRLTALGGGVPPTTSADALQAALIGILSDPDRTSVGPLEATIQEQLSTMTPLADSYRRNGFEVRQLQRRRSASIVERTDIASSQAAINQEWYRSITPVEPTSNLPVAIAMAFAAGVPAALASAALVALNINRRLNNDEELQAPRLANAA